MKLKSSFARFGVASVAIAAVAIPTVASAVGNLEELVRLVLSYFNLAIYFIMALAIVLFFWNVFNYFFKADGDKTEAGKYVMYSVIGFAIMLTFWGLVNLVINSVQLNNSSPSGIGVGIPASNSGGNPNGSSFWTRLSGKK
jgi:membrane protease YdiL (CAAX protease family)